MKKKWYKSKTLYVNIIGIAVIIFGADKVTPEMTATALAVVNFVMRLITKEGLTT